MTYSMGATQTGTPLTSWRTRRGMAQACKGSRPPREVTVFRPSGFLQDDFARWHVEVGRGEDGGDAIRVRGGERHHDVEVVRETGFTIDHGGHRAGDHVGNAEIVERSDEQRDEVRRLHRGRSPERGR